ncbi:hypothetical protein ACHAQJ_010754, partial [Trichoderma viride]
MSAEEDQALDMWQRANLSLREAILANFLAPMSTSYPQPRESRPINTMPSMQRSYISRYHDAAMYAAEKKARTILIIPWTDRELIKKKGEWLTTRAALAEAQMDESSAQLSANGAANLRTSIKSRIMSLNLEIQRLEGCLAGNNPPDMIVGIEGDRNGAIEKSKPDTGSSAGGSGRGDSGTANVWSDIAFTVSAQTDDHKQEEHGMSG